MNKLFLQCKRQLKRIKPWITLVFFGHWYSKLISKLTNQFLNGVYRHHRFWPFTDTLKFSENWSYHISVIREFSVKSSREKWYSKEHVGEISDRPGVTVDPAHPDQAFDKSEKHVIEPLLDFCNIFFLLYWFQNFQVQLLKTMLILKN